MNPSSNKKIFSLIRLQLIKVLAFTTLPLLLIFFLGASASSELAYESEKKQKLEAIPNDVADILMEYCIDCHDADIKKGNVNLDHLKVDWNDPKSIKLWSSVLQVSQMSLMPPENKRQPKAVERKTIVDWLDDSLIRHTSIGGTLPRRLSKREYEKTIRQLFEYPEFRVPIGFPGDTDYHGFDNMSKGLILSRPLLEEYARVATMIADDLFLSKKKIAKKEKWKISPEDLVISYSSGSRDTGVMRLASSTKLFKRSATWPSKFEVKQSGVYKIKLKGGAFKPAKPMVLEIKARFLNGSSLSYGNSMNFLDTIVISNEKPKVFTLNAELYQGQQIFFRWANSPIGEDNKDELIKFFRQRYSGPRQIAAWQKVLLEPPILSYTSGGIAWDLFKKYLNQEDLDISQSGNDSKKTKHLLKNIRISPRRYVDTISYDFFENGPALEIHSVEVQGPLKLVDSPRDLAIKKRRKALMGERPDGVTDEEWVREVLIRLLPRAFRRPVSQAVVQNYLDIGKVHWNEGYSFEEGMHLILRNVLISPRFLYRSVEPHVMDDYDLASRLAYFLTSGPPGEVLVQTTKQGKISEISILKKEAKRMMDNEGTLDSFSKAFTSQWLDTKLLLTEIMPDQKFKFFEKDMKVAIREVELFFIAMYKENRPMTDFINPHFTYTTKRFAGRIYNTRVTKEELAKKDILDNILKKDKMGMLRVTMKPYGQFGGLLGQSAIMIATANGVDTQPVLRGAWILENILGRPTPEPPNEVPALTPDTRGAKTPRDILTAHTQTPACANCHKHIDPVGFVMENFDPVGRWRDKWPDIEVPIESRSVLPDGTEISDVIDFKRWLVENIDVFSVCLSEKLMSYATGRVPNYKEKKEIKEIVENNRKEGNKFQDLFLSLVTSSTFRTK